jgi:hypothetical protein
MAANRDTDKTDTVAVELRLDRIPRLYNSLDPAPFHEKELEAAADDYIVGSAEDAGGRPIRLVVMLPSEELARPEAQQVPASIRHHSSFGATSSCTAGGRSTAAAGCSTTWPGSRSS